MNTKCILTPNVCRALRSRILLAVFALVAMNGAFATTFTFSTPPFQGTPVLTAPGRQIVSGDEFINFNPARDVFQFDSTAFGISQIKFANDPVNLIPSMGIDTVVLDSTDDDANPLTPFTAGNAADLIASRITDHGPGLFIYFSDSLSLPRLVYSSDLSSTDADLKLLARILNLYGQLGIAALPTFSAANFAIQSKAPTGAPEPSGFALIGEGIGLCGLSAALRRYRLRKIASPNSK